jgi:hypothetical protein
MNRIRYFLMTLLIAGPFFVSPSAQQEPNNCALVVGGQGFYISGGTGGFTLKPNYITNFSEIKELLSNAVYQPRFDEPVAIIIADDFRTDGNPDPLSSAATAGTEAGLAKLKIRHGEAVFAHISEVLAATGYFGQPTTTGNQTTWKSSQGTSVTVIKVDVGNYDTARIANELQAVYNGLIRTQIRRVVFNFSFVVLPCALVRGDGGQDDISYETYVDKLDAQTSGSAVNIFQQYISDVSGSKDLAKINAWIADQIRNMRLSNDPLWLFIRRSLDGTTPTEGMVSFISSSGNHGPIFKFSLYPGAWPEVINVSATEGGRMWSEASPGEVTMPGAWYRLPGSSVYYAGTSFAAPVFSTLAALALSNQPIECPFNVTESAPLMARLPAIRNVPSHESVVNRDCPNPKLEWSDLSRHNFSLMLPDTMKLDPSGQVESTNMDLPFWGLENGAVLLYNSQGDPAVRLTNAIFGSPNQLTLLQGLFLPGSGKTGTADLKVVP